MYAAWATALCHGGSSVEIGKMHLTLNKEERCAILKYISFLLV